MPNIYTVGCQRLKLADLQALASAINAGIIYDWRTNPDGRLSPPTLERTFPGKYKYIGDKCNDKRIPDAAIDKLAATPATTLLLFHKPIPGNCTRHEKLAMPLVRRGATVAHVFENTVIDAAEYQRSITDDNDYQFTEWRSDAVKASVAPAALPPTTHMAPISSINQLSDRAMLVRLSLHMPGFQRQNKKVSDEVAAKYGSDSTMGRFVESLIAKEAMSRLNQIESSLRQEYYRRTLPWDQDGVRIVSAAGYMSLVEFVRSGQAQWDPAVDAFCNDWDSHVAEAKRKRNGLFDPSQYKTREQVRHSFEFIWRVSPVPTEDDFRCKITADELRVIQEQNADLLRHTIKQSMGDIWARLKGVVSDMRERLKAVESGESKTVRDSIVTNIDGVLAIVPSLNLTGDPDVARFCAEIQQQLTTTEPKALREDPKVREDVIARADEILSKMEQFI